MLYIFNKKWDLIVVDSLFATHGFAYASYFYNKYDIPYIDFSPTMVFTFQTWSINTGFFLK